jgi:hypothetical protein
MVRAGLVTCLVFNLQAQVREQSPVTETAGITVLVVDKGGVPVPEADVEVRDSHDTVVIHETLKNGLFEIPDLGFGPHTIVVGKDRCGEVQVKNLVFVWDVHQIIRIVSNVCPHSGATGGSGCFVLFRVKNTRGEPVVGATMKGDAILQETVTDIYGRSSAILGANSSDTFTIQLDDYIPARVHVACGFFGTVRREIVLSLDRVR